MKTLREYIDIMESIENNVLEGELQTYKVNVMDERTGEHWAISVKVTSPEAAKERAEAQGYKVLGVKAQDALEEMINNSDNNN